MCGIFGVCRHRSEFSPYNLTIDREYDEVVKKAFTKLMLRSIERGSDSSGLFLVQNDNHDSKSFSKEVQITVYKDSLPSTAFVETDKYKDIIKGVNEKTSCIIGHTRSATSGSSEFNKNNHPFICGRIVGVHNGVISNWRELADKFNIILRSECDSEIIFALINLFLEGGASIKESVQRAASELVGWMACALIDTKNPNDIILFRRKAPLHIKSIRTENILLFASSEIYIHSAICEKIEGPFRVYDSKTGILEDNHAIVIENFGGYDWLSKTQSFSLTPKAQ
jgi:amidophosphoribosyltransferase